jgi:hypothetical protein
MTRSYSLIEGFLDAFDRWNPVVAAPLLRMQLDSLVRVHYIATVKGSRPFAERLIAGEEFRNITDAEGKRLTDHRLNELAKDDHPWIESVCKATSGWVHFSPEHLRAAFQVQEQDDGTFTIAGGIPIRPEQIPVSALEELIGAMIQATEELGTYMESWEARKDRK